MTTYRVLVYHGTLNLGDALQTAALTRLLPGRVAGVYRHRARQCRPGQAGPFVINGWLGDEAPASGADCVFAGVHIGNRGAEHMRWLASSPSAIGARDPFTADFLRSSGLDSEMIGCATLTLPRYRGRRAGRYAVDWFQPHTAFLSNHLEDEASWPRQWALAMGLLEILRTAAVVYTTRLHVALPCLAYGTPVVVPRRAVELGFQPARFSLLDAIGFKYDEPFTADVTPSARRYTEFLSRQLGCELRQGPFQFPTPIE